MMVNKPKIKLDIYLVTDRRGITEAQFFDIILKAVRGGVTSIQLREKDTPIKDFIRIGKKLKSLLSSFKIPLIINDRVDVALAVEAEGIHLGQTDMCPLDARKIMGKNAFIGLSIEAIDQIDKANELPIDYVAASPVFSTPTKTDTALPLGIEGVYKLQKLSHHPLVAIGGINLENASCLKKAGAAGIAIVSGIFKAPDPLTATRHFKEIWS